jgi:hypothetical protein
MRVTAQQRATATATPVGGHAAQLHLAVFQLLDELSGVTGLEDDGAAVLVVSKDLKCVWSGGCVGVGRRAHRWAAREARHVGSGMDTDVRAVLAHEDITLAHTHTPA